MVLNMIVANYISSDLSKMLFSSVAINQKYTVKMGDEYFYHFIGKTVGINILDFIHPDFQKEFCESCEKLESGESVRLISALKSHEEGYQQVDLTISNLGHTIQGEQVFDMIIYNIFHVEKKCIDNINNTNRYRAFLSMYQDYLFDYDEELDRISVFYFEGIRSTVILKCSLEEFRKRVVALYPKPIYQDELQEFCEQLLTAKEMFSCSLRGPVPKDPTEMMLFQINGRVVYKHNQRKMVVGVLRPLNHKSEIIIPYYATAEGKDCFTGLLNKRACTEYVTNALATDDSQHYLAIIDNFKNINDRYGHMYGDLVISEVANIINSTLNGRGIVGRFGGDEFFIFTNWIQTEAHLRAILTTIRKRVQNTFEMQKEHCQITLSIGISAAPTDGKTYDELFLKADKCLYLAKNKGKNRFVIYEKDKHENMDNDDRFISKSIDPQAKAEYLADTVADIGIQLLTRDTLFFDEILNQIKTAFEIDGIRIYRAGHKDPLYICGAYKAIPDMHSLIINDTLISEMNEKNYLRASHIETLAGAQKELYEIYKNGEIEGFVCFGYPDKEGKNLYFFYDVFNQQFRWSESDKNFLLTISRMMSQVI